MSGESDSRAVSQNPTIATIFVFTDNSSSARNSVTMFLRFTTYKHNTKCGKTRRNMSETKQHRSGMGVDQGLGKTGCWEFL